MVLGDREFCSVDLAKWLSEEAKVYLSLRLKKNEYVELEEQIWFQLDTPQTSDKERLVRPPIWVE